VGREYLISDAKSLKLAITVPYTEMLTEAINLRANFIQYNQGNDYRHQGWYSLPLYGLGDDKVLAWKGYGYTNAQDAIDNMNWTIWSALCPVTTSWLKEIFPSNYFGRVRFMLLEAGGYIAPHTDSDLRVLEAVNIALSNSKECLWQWGDGTELSFTPGDAYAMNISYEHAIYNRSNEDRYHLIIHHYDSLPEWKELMIKSMKEHNVQGNFLYSQDLY
jgi:hypothetical protein